MSKECAVLNLLRDQTSHVLFALSNAVPGNEEQFKEWYRHAYRSALKDASRVLSARYYVQHDFDIMQGRLPRLQFEYLGVYEMSLDGAHEATEVIERVQALHAQQEAALAPATWLYYPISPKVGRPAKAGSMLTIAFANGVPGQENEFREWYSTRHIRHALNVPALVSGQCFERTVFQSPGAADAVFSTIALYEQEGTPESITASLEVLRPKGVLAFPALDKSRFAEWVYRPV